MGPALELGKILSGWRSVSESNVYQQLFAADTHYVAKGSFATPGKIEVYAAIADSKITNLNLFEPIGQLGIKNIQYIARRAGTKSED